MGPHGRRLAGRILLQPQKLWIRDSRVAGKPFARQDVRFQNCFMSRPGTQQSPLPGVSRYPPLLLSPRAPAAGTFAQSHQTNTPSCTGSSWLSSVASLLVCASRRASEGLLSQTETNAPRCLFRRLFRKQPFSLPPLASHWCDRQASRRSWPSSGLVDIANRVLCLQRHGDSSCFSRIARGANLDSRVSG